MWRATAVALLIICSVTSCSDDPAGDEWARLGGTDAPIYALQEFKGRLIFGGEFTRVDAFGPDEEVHHLAAFADAEHRDLNPDVWDNVVQVSDAAGTWANIDPEPNGNVHAMTIFRGDLIVAGAFTYVGSVRANGVARWDGNEWHALGDDGVGGGVEGTVYALANDNDVTLFVGGNLTAAGGAPLDHIAQWNGLAWAPLGAGIEGTVYALHSRARALFAGGAFTVAGGEPANHVARWSGTAWSPLDVGVDGTVRALTTYRGALIAGGDFVTVNGFEMNHVARWVGAAWLIMGAGLPDVESVHCLMVVDEAVWAGQSEPDDNAILDGWDSSTWQGLLDDDGRTVWAGSNGDYGPCLAIDDGVGGEILRR